MPGSTGSPPPVVRDEGPVDVILTFTVMLPVVWGGGVGRCLRPREPPPHGGPLGAALLASPEYQRGQPGAARTPEAVLYVSAYLLSRGKRAVLGEKTE